MFVSLVNLMDYSTELTVQYHHKRGFPGGSVGKEPACNAGDTRDTGLILGSGRTPGGGHDNTPHYFCLENPMDRRAWWDTDHGVAESWT